MREAWRAPSAVKPHRQLGHPLLDRLKANEASLIDSYRSICTAVDDKAAITPAAEWLIDNFHLVERQIREVRLDLPPRLLSPIAQARRRPLCRAAEGVRAGLGVRRAHRQPVRCRHLVRLHPRLSGGAAAHDRRIVGFGDHPAHHPGRESEADRRAHRLQPRRAPQGGRDRRRSVGRRRPRANGRRAGRPARPRERRPTRWRSS